MYLININMKNKQSWYKKYGDNDKRRAYMKKFMATKRLKQKASYLFQNYYDLGIFSKEAFEEYCLMEGISIKYPESDEEGPGGTKAGGYI